MWIVQIALRRPYTFVVMALAILLAGGVAIARMPADIFPDIDIPIVSVVWQFAGLTPETMANIITTRSERGMTTTVNDIEHMESQTMQGVSVIRLYFQPGAKIESAVAQIAAQTTQQVGFMPDGSRPPNVVRYNAASVPILQLGLSSDTLSEQEVYDLGNNFMRTQLATIQGAAIPPPFGGKSRQVMVDLNPDALYARGLSPADVSGALSSQNVIMPSGTAKIGTREYRVEMNNSPEVIEAFNRLPIKTVNGSTVYVRDVAQVHDGYAVQQNVVRHDGKRGALLTVLKNGNESTINIVKRVKDVLPRIQSTLPRGLRVAQLFDQSIFVRAAISGVVREAVAAALLTGMMILLFLGSWRSTLIVCVSIPLSILSSLAILYAMGETINIMTLGGMALAVGILVDDATVTIENIHRNIGMGKNLLQAILDGAQQISVPAFVSTLCICIVFVPVAFLGGTAKFLFTPLALAVVLAMAASYILSRTLVPTMIHFLLPAEMGLHQGPDGEADVEGAGWIWHIHHVFNRVFEKMQDTYCDILDSALHHRWLVVCGFVLLAGSSAALYSRIGTDFFPLVDAGQIRLHVRAPSGTRIEETEARVGEVERAIRQIVPPNEVAAILDNIGLPTVGFNLAWGDSVTISSSDGEILVSLKPEHHSSFDYVREMRRRLAATIRRPVVFLPAGRHREPDFEFRIAGADRRADRRPGAQFREEFRAGRGNIAADRGDSRHRRRARAPGAGRSHDAHGCGPGSRQRARLYAARRGQQHADFAHRHRAGGPEFLAEPAQRSDLQRSHANAHRRHGLTRSPARHTFAPGRRADPVFGERRQHQSPPHVRRGQPLQRTAGLRHLRRHSGPRPGRRLRRTWTKSWPNFRRSCRPGVSSMSAGRRPPCAAPSRAWLMDWSSRSFWCTSSWW